MKDLLKRWAQLEPARCELHRTGSDAYLVAGKTGAWVSLGSPSGVDAGFILAATIEAIEAHKGRFTLKRDIGDGHYFAAVRFPSQKTPRNAKSYQPAAALLLAYLAVLEAEANS